MHIAEGGYQSSIDWMAGHGTSAHFIVSKEGEVSQMVSVKDSAWANGLQWKQGRWWSPDEKRKVNPTWSGIVPDHNPNLYTISIEHEGFTGQALTPEMRAATIELLKWVASETGLVYVADRTLIRHGQINPVDRRHCPGAAFDLVELAVVANADSQPTPTTRFFPETEQYLSNAFLLFWEALDRMLMPNGGGSVAIALLGYPIRPEEHATVGDWEGTVQYCQKERLEWHPDNPEGHKVLVGLLGVEALA
jgi:hypothetical protein